MPIPEFNEIKAPAIQFFADGQAHKISEVYAKLADQFNLTDDERNELLPSGTQRRWQNRANWACYDLFRAGLLDRPKRGVYVITELGKKIANQKPTIIDRAFLMKFEGFANFVQSSGAKPTNDKSVDPELLGKYANEETPEELIESAFQVLNRTLEKVIIDYVKKMDPFRFEHLVLDLLVQMGYGGSLEEAGRVTKKSGDEGIDGIINEDKLGLDVIYLQAKRWKQTIGRKEIQSFVGENLPP